ncbi:spermine oxidase-like isoform X4 [Mobula hypostoma]|uniref:spermine oxidase-like isoform X4 n=1 Tax=Mobula hypostoma TaxID=723540 RepID=UPI002FC35152
MLILKGTISQMQIQLRGWTGSKNMPKKGPKVVVIGAGIAGVGAAGKLLTQGLTDVQIIEASSQPGGRIRGSLFGKSTIDEGAQYIHGASTKNPVYQLAKEHDLLQETHDRLFPNLLQKLLEAIPREKLLLKKPIKQIQWNGSFESGGSSVYSVRVVCEDGDHILADHIIVSISLGCLKANGQAFFQPRLPEQKLSAIQSLGFGTMNKIYLEYETPFWDENTDVIGLVWEDETPFSVQKPNLTEWWKHVPVFYVIRPTERYGHVLVGTISGKEAEFVESLNPQEVASRCTYLFRQFTGRSSLPELKSVYVTKWFSNPYTRGSYSHISITSTGAMIDQLAEPLPQATEGSSSPMLQVLFAGEATHRSYHSTTHGALLSGWREATRLIDHYSTK